MVKRVLPTHDRLGSGEGDEGLTEVGQGSRGGRMRRTLAKTPTPSPESADEDHNQF